MIMDYLYAGGLTQCRWLTFFLGFFITQLTTNNERLFSIEYGITDLAISEMIAFHIDINTYFPLLYGVQSINNISSPRHLAWYNQTLGHDLWRVTQSYT